MVLYLASNSCAFTELFLALATCSAASWRMPAVMLTVPLKFVNSNFFSSKSYAFSEKARELEAFIDDELFY